MKNITSTTPKGTEGFSISYNTEQRCGKRLLEELPKPSIEIEKLFNEGTALTNPKLSSKTARIPMVANAFFAML